MLLVVLNRKTGIQAWILDLLMITSVLKDDTGVVVVDPGFSDEYIWKLQDDNWEMDDNPGVFVAENIIFKKNHIIK